MHSWADIEAEYTARDTSAQFGHVDLASFTDPNSPGADFPLLKGKAAEAKCLVPIMLSVFRKYMDRSRDYDRHVERVLAHLATYYECLDYRDDRGQFPYVQPRAIVNKMRKAIDKFLNNYSFLSQQANANGRRLWNTTPKFHSFYHIGQEALYMSPRLSWCYSNEDYVGRIAILGDSSKFGLIAPKRSIHCTLTACVLPHMFWGTRCGICVTVTCFRV